LDGRLRLLGPDAAVQRVPGADDVPDSDKRWLQLRCFDDAHLPAADVHDADARDHAADSGSEYGIVLRAASECVTAAGPTGLFRPDAILSFGLGSRTRQSSGPSTRVCPESGDFGYDKNG
jgi:hypothetical protein